MNSNGNTYLFIQKTIKLIQLSKKKRLSIFFWFQIICVCLSVCQYFYLSIYDLSPTFSPICQSSLECSIWHSFCSFSYSRLYSLELAFFSYDVIVVPKSSSREEKVNFQGVGLLLSLHSFTKITFIGNNTLWVDLAPGTVIVKELMTSEESFIWSEYTWL